MSFEILNKNLFDVDVQTIVNPVNTVGVMGVGLALHFKKKYPDMYYQYRKHCDSGLLTVGRLWVYDAGDRKILNFPTKTHWRLKSEIEYINSGLENLAVTYKRRGITSIAFPLIGCGHGGLAKEVVIDSMDKYLSNIKLSCYLCLSYQKLRT